MDNIFKKLIYTSVGFASLTAKKVEEMVNELSAEGKLSSEEGERIMKDFTAATKQTKEDLEKDLQDVIESVINKMNVAKQDELNRLEQRVTALEQRENLPKL